MRGGVSETNSNHLRARPHRPSLHARCRRHCHSLMWHHGSWETDRASRCVSGLACATIVLSATAIVAAGCSLSATAATRQEAFVVGGAFLGLALLSLGGVLVARRMRDSARRFRAPRIHVLRRVPVVGVSRDGATARPVPTLSAPPDAAWRRQPVGPRTEPVAVVSPALCAPPTSNPTPVARVQGTETCAICLESCDNARDDVAGGVCGHRFHAACINAWLARAFLGGGQPTCPLGAFGFTDPAFSRLLRSPTASPHPHSPCADRQPWCPVTPLAPFVLPQGRC